MQGSFDRGFPVLLRIQEQRRLNPRVIQVEGHLPPSPQVLASFKEWEYAYHEMSGGSFRITPSSSLSTNVSIPQLADSFTYHFKDWLKSGNWEWHKVRECLLRSLNFQEEILVIVETQDLLLQRLPWHLWDLFSETFTNAEIALSAASYQPPPLALSRYKTRVLVVLGSNSNGINVDEDRKVLEQFSQVDLHFLVTPSLEDLTKLLWEQSWDILYFAGHSSSQPEGTGGFLMIQDTEVPLKRLKYGLEQALLRGLRLAIFNSCDGLGLARELADLHIPQIVVMRQPVPDKVAQEFLKFFLAAFTSGQSLYLAVQTARRRLQGLEDQFPCASWLPVICQNPAELPLQPPKVSLWQRSRAMFLVSMVVAACVIGIRQLGILQPMEWQVFDRLQLLRPPEQPDPRLLVVTITESDIQKRKEWPLTDRTLSQVLSRLEQYQPQVIGLDIYRDFSIPPSSENLLPHFLNPRLIGLCAVPTPEQKGVPAPPGVFGDRLGFSDVVVDDDGIIRRHLLFLQPDLQSSCLTTEAFSLQLALRYLGVQGIKPQLTPKGEYRIQKARFPSIEDEAISSIDVLQIGTNTNLAAQDSFALLPDWLQSHIPFGSNKFNELSEELSRQRTARLREAANELETFDRIRDKVKDFNLVTEVPIMKGLGQSYDAVKQYSKAISNYNSALALAKKYGDRFGEAETNYLMAVTEQKRGNSKAAKAKIEAALNVVEDFRSKVVDPQLRSSYFASVQEYYEFYIDVLMQLHKQQPSQGFNALALQASERARARSLLDLLNESRTDIRQGVDPKLLEQEENLQFKLNALEKSRIELYSKTPTEAQKASFEQKYNTLLSQYRNIETRIRASSLHYAALTQPQALTLNQLQQQILDDNTVLLEYFLGTEHSYLWAVSKSEITSYELPKQSEIEATTQKFITLVQNSNARPSEISKAGTPLSQMLLGPVAKQLGQKRLLIVSNRALQYLPFATLPAPTGSQFLLSEHEIINLPSVSTLATLRQQLNGRKPAPKAVAVFADPVFSPTDERVAQRKDRTPASNDPTQDSVNTEPFSAPILQEQIVRDASQEAGIDLERLAESRTEAKDILQLLPVNMRSQALDFEANKNNVLNSNLSQYRIIHFATHGILNTTRPELSAVVLSLVDPQGRPQSGFLRLNDIFNLNLPAELVVLSACKTGLGQDMRGEGLIGLTRGFMYAGSPRVLASLWSVNDESTAVFMTLFYKAMLEKGLPPAAALRTAQLELQKQEEWQSPYYWAAFTLQGEWR
jgi:CHAT domain-containing protein